MGPRARRADGEREACAVPRGEPDRRAPDHHEGDPGGARAPGGAQGARAHAAQERARDLVAAGQARRLPDQRPRGRRALHRRGQLGRRLGRRRARPPLPGDPAAARQDDQHREEPHQQGALERRDPGDDHGDRHGHRRGVRHREAALPPRDRDDGRRRRRLAHPHADPHVPVPPDAGAGRERARLHRRAAALPREDRQPGVVRREGSAARGAARARADQGLRHHRPRRRDAEADRGALGTLHARADRVRGLVARLRSDFGPAAADFVVTHRLVETEAGASKDVEKALGRSRRTATRSRSSTSATSRSRRRSIERETSAATHVTVPAELLASPSTRTCARRTRSSTEIVGPPPFSITIGKKTPRRRDVRRAAARVARAREGGHHDVAASRASAR